MHSNAHLMLRKFAATMPSGIGGIAIYRQDNYYSIHLFINLNHSL